MRGPVLVSAAVLAVLASPLAAQQPSLVPPGSFRGTLLGLAVYDPQIAIAVGYDGVILRTQDGGSNWWRIPAGTGAVLDGVTFTGVTVFAVGGSGTILRSSDGGVNWMALPSGASVRLKSVHFGDAAHGVIVGEAGTALWTQDGGATWAATATGTSSDLIDVRMAGLSAVAVGVGGVVLKSEDGGRTWLRMNAPTSAYLTGVTISSARIAVIVGLDGAALWNRNIGTEGWASGMMASTAGMSDVAYVDGPTLVTVGSSATVLRSGDFGQSWQVSWRSNGFAFEDVGFADARTGWAVGNQGVIMRTTDGGVSWSHQGSVPAAAAAPAAQPLVTTQSASAPLYLQILGLTVPAPAGPTMWSPRIGSASNGNRMDELHARGNAGETYAMTIIHVDNRTCANVLAQLVQQGAQLRTGRTYVPASPWFQVTVEQNNASAFTCLPLANGVLVVGFTTSPIDVAQTDANVVRPALFAVGEAAQRRWGRQ